MANAKRKDKTLTFSLDTRKQRPGMLSSRGNLEQFPWWLAVVILIGILVLYSILTTPNWQSAFLFIQTGLKYTIGVSLTAFAISLVFGLLTAFGQISKNPIFRNLAMLYVQII